MAVKPASQWVTRWQNGANAAGPTWLAGIQSTSVDVMGKAVNAGPAAIAGYTQSIQSGAYARAVAASGGTANWKTKSEAKQANYGVGIAAGLSKYESAAGKLAGAMPAMVNSLPQRGPVGSGQNEQRVLGMMRALHARKGDFKG